MSEQDDASPATGRARTREHVVRAAAALLADGGRDAVSTRSVAAAAGTQPPTIYRLFGDKAGLLGAVAEHGYATYLAAKPPARTGVDPVGELRAGWDLHVEFGLANPALFSLMYGDPRPGEPCEAAVRGLEVLRAKVDAVAAAGRLRVDTGHAARLMHAAACGVVLTLLASSPERRDPALSGAAFDAVIAATTTDGPAAAGGGPVAAANALRADLGALTALTEAERSLLDEWLARTTRGPSDGGPDERTARASPAGSS
ncbi:TetR/AcrR family transcriptional regulator [uncultured Pseudokineococcus sp.]|uniref:TetR/AcrR family transcriptional regulator n=1 Tax=uncultured Pseudokineococcus sp. TaxID=1642928 RepID=UPI00262535DF|nr:TetR/AcrR family transcriptional regulator [uncultured Pseudokineococcus sp.]